MPSAFDNALGYVAGQQQMNEMSRLRQQQMTGQYFEAQQRAEELRLYRDQLNQYRQQQFGLSQQKYQDKYKFDQATVDYVMGLNPNQVEPAWRTYLTTMQQYLANNPNPEVAKSFVQKYRPGGLQFKAVPTTDADGKPTTAIYAWDPMGGGAVGAVTPPAGAAVGGRVAPAPGAGGASGITSPTPPPPAAPTYPGLSPRAARLLNKHMPAPAPPPAGGGTP